MWALLCFHFHDFQLLEGEPFRVALRVDPAFARLCVARMDEARRQRAIDPDFEEISYKLDDDEDDWAIPDDLRLTEEEIEEFQRMVANGEFPLCRDDDEDGAVPRAFRRAMSLAWDDDEGEDGENGERAASECAEREPRAIVLALRSGRDPGRVDQEFDAYFDLVLVPAIPSVLEPVADPARYCLGLLVSPNLICVSLHDLERRSGGIYHAEGISYDEMRAVAEGRQPMPRGNVFRN